MVAAVLTKCAYIKWLKVCHLMVPVIPVWAPIMVSGALENSLTHLQCYMATQK